MNTNEVLNKLIAEIERRKKELFEIGGDTFENKWACGSLDNIKAFVISLQQEQPEVELKKDIDEKWDEFVSSEGEREDFTNIARHFYELGLNARKEE